MKESSPKIIFIIIITLLIAQSETEDFLPLTFVYFNLRRCSELFVFPLGISHLLMLKISPRSN